MDLTILFKACIKTVQTRNKFLNNSTSNNVTNSNILKKKKVQKNGAELIKNAKKILRHISELRNFLLENKRAYLNIANVNLKDGTPPMTDAERDEIDKEAQKFTNECLKMISELKKQSVQIRESPQYLQHIDAIIESLESYLKSTCKIYSEQKAIRVKRALELHKMSKIENLLGKKPDNRKQQPIFEPIPPPSPSGDDISNKLSPEEIQMFESENEQLFEELSNTDEMVKQIETKVVHISELQSLFTEKILEQDKDIERISTTVIASTENIRSANDQIRQAIQRNAGLRVYILFFLIVMSLTLLFLDWYND